MSFRKTGSRVIGGITFKKSRSKISYHNGEIYEEIQDNGSVVDTAYNVCKKLGTVDREVVFDVAQYMSDAGYGEIYKGNINLYTIVDNNLQSRGVYPAYTLGFNNIVYMANKVKLYDLNMRELRELDYTTKEHLSSELASSYIKVDVDDLFDWIYEVRRNAAIDLARDSLGKSSDTSEHSVDDVINLIKSYAPKSTRSSLEDPNNLYDFVETVLKGIFDSKIQRKDFTDYLRSEAAIYKCKRAEAVVEAIEGFASPREEIK